MTDPNKDPLHALACSFPVIRDYAPDVVSATERDELLEALAKFAHDASRGAMWAAVFVISVYNPRAVERWELPAFDLFKAWTRWDGHQRAAFARWAAEPFTL